MRSAVAGILVMAVPSLACATTASTSDAPPPAPAIKPRHVSAKEYGVKGDGRTDDTAALEAALVAADGATLELPPATYRVKFIDVLLRSGIRLEAKGAKLTNVAQTPSGKDTNRPILRVRGERSTLIYIDGIEIDGPRETRDRTTVTSDAPLRQYQAQGFPSGIDISTADSVTLTNVRVSGTYYTGIEVHFVGHADLNHDVVSNNGYAGITVSEVGRAELTANTVDDSGSEMVTNGYGISAQSSYASGNNGVVRVIGNNVTRSKRKGIDVHNGLDVVIANNNVVGFGNAGIYAVCEEANKSVRDVVIQENRVRGDPVFSPQASGAAVEVGVYGSAVSQSPTFVVARNDLANLKALAGLYVYSGADKKHTIKSITVSGNVVNDSEFRNAVILFSNSGTITEAVTVIGNSVSAKAPNAALSLTNARDVTVRENAFAGQIPGLLIGVRPPRLLSSKNTLNGAVVPDETKGSDDKGH